MAEAIPRVPRHEDGYRGAAIELVDGVHVHARVRLADLVNGGLFLEADKVEKVHRGSEPSTLRAALGVDDKHFKEDQLIWLPGHRIAAIFWERAEQPPRQAGFRPSREEAE